MTSAEINNKEIFDLYRQSNSVELRNLIVEKHLYIVDILIKKYRNKGVEYEDLYQVGSMALVFAVERYDPSKGYEFNSFATPTIIGEIKRYFRDKGWAVKVPRRLKEISAQMSLAREVLYSRYNRIPTIKELAEYLGHSEDELLEAMEGSQSYSTYSLNQSFDDGGEEGENLLLERYTGMEEIGFHSLENADLIRKVLDELSEKEKVIFIRRYLKNETQLNIAEGMGVSQMTISRTEKKIRDKFREAVKA